MARLGGCALGAVVTGVFQGMLGIPDTGDSIVSTTLATGGSERLRSIVCFMTGSVLGSCHTAPLVGTLVSTLSTGWVQLLFPDQISSLNVPELELAERL